MLRPTLRDWGEWDQVDGLRERHRRRKCFIGACAPVGEPNDVAYRGMVVTNLRAELHLVTLPDVDRPSIPTGAPMPGFEMALV